jgi:transposase, IS5 family
MARRRIGQLGWMDAAVSQRGAQRRDVLSELCALLDWSRFAVLLNGIHAAAKGEAAYPPLMMFKVLLVQRWYGLSDPAMEEALYDRLSFQRFCGLSLEDETPDHTTIWRFRETLSRAGLDTVLLAELNRQLDGHGVLLKQGTLIDASLVRSAARRPRLAEGKTSPVDPDARFGANNERRFYTFGYKMHLAVDAGSTLVREAKLTSANIQEISVATELVQGDEAEVLADRGYDGRSLHDHLAARGIADGVMRRGQRGKPLGADAILRNHELAVRRRPVEAVFGTLKRCYRFHRMRYFNLGRNRLAVVLACFAYNLKRCYALTAS